MESPTVDRVRVKDEERRRKGGLISIPFILVNESLEKMASYGLQPNMITYLTKEYGMSLARGTVVLNWWSFATNFMPFVGAFMADSFLGRFLTIALGSFSCFLGMVLLWLTAMIPGWKPSQQESATVAQYAILAIAFALMSIGAGGVRPCSQALGADQLIMHNMTNNNNNNNNNNNDNDNKETRHVVSLESFFNWYYACSCLSVIIGITVIVYIQDHAGWRLGFGLPALLLLASIVSFLAASSLYVKVEPVRSVLASFVHVIVAAYKNRHLPFPPGDQLHYVPSKHIMVLNKACLPTNCPSCTVEQVEELKALIRVLPIWLSGIMLSINVNQVTFQVYQANAMDRHVGGFEVPAASIGIILILAIVVWVAVYDRLIIPTSSWMRMGVKLRMGVGLIFTTAAMAVAALVETTRRGKALMPMSAFWLLPQYALNGIGEALNVIGQTEFYYSEFPKSMSSIATALSGMGAAVAALLCNAIISAIDAATTNNQGRGESWVASDPNKAHYDYYYWILAGLSFLNLTYYVFCSWAYGPCQEQPSHTNYDADSDLQPCLN